MAIRSVDFVSYAERIVSSERACEVQIVSLEHRASELQSEISRLESEIAYLESEIASAYYVDSEGNYHTDYSLISSIRMQQASCRSRINMASGELSSVRHEITVTKIELARIRAEKADAIAEIQDRAVTTSRNITKAGLMTGDYLRTGANLQGSFQTSLNALSRAASILGSHISTGGGGGSSGGHGSRSRGGSASVRRWNGGSSFSGGLHALSGQGSGTGRSSSRFQSTSRGTRSQVRQMRSAGSTGISHPKRQRTEFQSAKSSAVSSSSVFASVRSAASVQPSGRKYASSRSASGISRTLHSIPVRRGDAPPIDLNMRYASNTKFKQNGVTCYTDDDGKIFRMGNKLLGGRTYTVGGYTYQTDDLGRIIMAGGVLQKKDHTGRGNMPDQMTAGSKAQNFSGDQRGHLIADMFNASGGMENFVAMDAHLNQVRYRSLEMKLAALVNDPAHDNQVSYFVRPVYHGGSYRPVGFAVEYTVNGEQFSERFYNGSLR